MIGVQSKKPQKLDDVGKMTQIEIVKFNMFDKHHHHIIFISIIKKQQEYNYTYQLYTR